MVFVGGMPLGSKAAYLPLLAPGCPASAGPLAPAEGQPRGSGRTRWNAAWRPPSEPWRHPRAPTLGETLAHSFHIALSICSDIRNSPIQCCLAVFLSLALFPVSSPCCPLNGVQNVSSQPPHFPLALWSPGSFVSVTETTERPAASLQTRPKRTSPGPQGALRAGALPPLRHLL